MKQGPEPTPAATWPQSQQPHVCGSDRSLLFDSNMTPLGEKSPPLSDAIGALVHGPQATGQPQEEPWGPCVDTAAPRPTRLPREDHHEVHDIPAVAQVGALVEDKAQSNNLHSRFEAEDADEVGLRVILRASTERVTLPPRGRLGQRAAAGGTPRPCPSYDPPTRLGPPQHRLPQLALRPRAYRERGPAPMASHVTVPAEASVPRSPAGPKQ